MRCCQFACHVCFSFHLDLHECLASNYNCGLRLSSAVNKVSRLSIQDSFAASEDEDLSLPAVYMVSMSSPDKECQIATHFAPDSAASEPLAACFQLFGDEALRSVPTVP